MNSSSTIASTTQAAHSDAANEVLAGLAESPKRIAPKYFYNRYGSELFSAITELDEYYIPATERHIIESNRTEICNAIGQSSPIVEPGAGSCEKIRWLLPELQPVVYVPMDISATHLKQSVAELQDECPELPVRSLVCDHSVGVDLPELQKLTDPVFFYPGSSIGNFEPEGVVAFLASLRASMGLDGGLLIGVDAKKDPDVLHAAYNDAEGLTAKFNLNVLSHLNKLLDANFALSNFAHLALYNEEQGRIEMHLRVLRSHDVLIAGETVSFAEGELVHTENSYKYHPDEFIALARDAGLEIQQVWQDSRKLFSVLMFRAAS